MGNQTSSGPGDMTAEKSQGIHMARFKKFIDKLIKKLNREIDSPDTPVSKMKMLQKEFESEQNYKKSMNTNILADLKAKYRKRLWKCKGDLQKIKLSLVELEEVGIYRQMVCVHMSNDLERLYKKKRIPTLQKAEKFLAIHTRVLRHYQDMKNSEVQWGMLEKGSLHRIVKNIDFKGYSQISHISNIKYSSMQSVGVSPRFVSTKSNSRQDSTTGMSSSKNSSDKNTYKSRNRSKMDFLSIEKPYSRSSVLKKSRDFDRYSIKESEEIYEDDYSVRGSMIPLEEDNVSIGKVNRTSNIYNLFDKSQNTGINVTLAPHHGHRRMNSHVRRDSQYENSNAYPKDTFRKGRNRMPSGTYISVRNSNLNKSKSSNIKLSIFDEEDSMEQQRSPYLDHFNNPGVRLGEGNDSVDNVICDYLNQMRRMNTK